jgi:hypothetical protein
VYPANILSLFPAHPRNNTVFVAMSFDPQFDDLWAHVLRPAVSDVTLNGVPLRPHRVDLARKGDSILTEIVQEIAEARLILADVTTIGWLRKNRRKEKPVRNGNVMYELGLAHASRLPEEVVVVRADSDPLDFDVSGVRVHRYPPNPDDATPFIGRLLVDALHAVDQCRTIAVRQALRSLTPHMFLLLHFSKPLTYPNPKTMRDFFATEETRAALKDLLRGGMVEAAYGALPPDFMNMPITDFIKYRPSPFVLAVYRAARSELKFNEALIPWLQSPEGRDWLNDMTQGSLAAPAK